jgi:hypothetical protein
MRRKLVAICIVSLAVVILGSPALADPGRGANVLCYLWANNASPTIGVPYTPSTIYSYNAIGRAQANSITKTATGVYSVSCKGVGGGALFSGSGSWGPGGHVQVSAYGDGNPNTCHVGSWGTGGRDFTASVDCFAPNGAPADSRFDFLVIW